MDKSLRIASVTVTKENKELHGELHQDLKSLENRVTAAETTNHTASNWDEVDWTKQPDGPCFYKKSDVLKQGVVYAKTLYYVDATGQMIEETA